MRLAKTIAALLPLLMSSGMSGGSFGDINGDSNIDGRDASLLLSYYTAASSGYTDSLEHFVDEIMDYSKSSTVETTPAVSAAKKAAPSDSVFGDISGDGIIDGRDASFLLTYYTAASTDYKGTLVQYMDEIRSTTTTPVTTETPVTTTVQSGEYTPVYDGRYILWLDVAKDKDYVFNGDFLKLTFRVKEGIPDNDYAIRIKTDFSNVKGIPKYPDKSINGTVRTGGGSIDPVDVSAENGFIVYGSNIACKQGDTFDYYISFKNNPGLAAILLSFRYDSSAMEFISAQAVGEFADVMDDSRIEVGTPDKLK